MWQFAVLWCYVEGVITVKVANSDRNQRASQSARKAGRKNRWPREMIREVVASEELAGKQRRKYGTRAFRFLRL